MQGNFEKKVQEKLEELKLTPSAPLWEKIELEIKVEKKRRKVWLWIPLLLLLGGGAWLWQQSGRRENSTASSTIKNSPHPATTTATSPLPAGREAKRNAPAETIVVKEKTAGNYDNETRAEAALNTDKINDNKQPVSNQNKKLLLAFFTKQKRANLIIQKVREKKSGLTGQKEQRPPFATKPADDTIALPLMENQTVEKAETTAITDSINSKLAVTVDTTMALPSEKQPELVKADTAATKGKAAAIRSKKWKLTFFAQVGWSSAAPGSAMANRDVYNSPSQSSGGGFSNNYAYPNSIGRGTAYALGMGLEKKLGRRWQLTVGLQYARFQTRSSVGSFSQIDTTIRFQSQSVDVGGYYRNGNQQSYATRFHMIELPLGIGYQLLRSVPLTLTVGGSYARLLKNNGLTFDPRSNLYYENKENQKLYQAAVFSSLQYAFVDKPSISLRTGPLVQYQLSAFQNENGTASKPLVFAGVKTSVRF